MCIAEGLRCGPPVGHDSGWCLKLPHHRAELFRLLKKHKPKILFGAPTCGPWSRASTTMDPVLKLALRAEEETVFEFFAECSEWLTNHSCFYEYENPKSSELLRCDTAQCLGKRSSEVKIAFYVK